MQVKHSFAGAQKAEDVQSITNHIASGETKQAWLHSLLNSSKKRGYHDSKHREKHLPTHKKVGNAPKEPQFCLKAYSGGVPNI